MKTTISNITLIQAQSIVASESIKSSPYPKEMERAVLAHRSLDNITVIEYATLKTELNNRINAENIYAPKIDRFCCKKRVYQVNSNFNDLALILTSEDYDELGEHLTSNYLYNLHKILALISFPVNGKGQRIERLQMQSDLLQVRFIDAWCIGLNLIESANADQVLEGINRMRNKTTKPATLIESDGAMFITI